MPAGELLRPLAAALDGSGPAVAPLDPALPQARLRLLLDELAPDAIQTVAGVTREGLAGGPPPGIGEDTAVVIVTSGSTGRPKGVELSADALLHSARASLDRIGAVPGGRWLCCLPVSHVAGIQVLVRSLLAGTEPVVCDRLTPEVVATCGCDYVSLVPTQLRRLVGDGASLAPFVKILLGGAGAPARLLAAAAAAGGSVVTTYGMTETSGGCVYDGKPLDGVRVGIGPGGLIRIAGPVLFSGYRLQPGRTGDGWFTTADLGSIGPSGLLTVRGRADDVINTGGEKVVGAEVAAALETFPAVREAVVVGRPDAEWGERVTAVVVPANPDMPPELGILREHVRRTLPASAAPRELVLMDELPLLPSGKPDLRALRHPISKRRPDREQ
ncbi:MAG TPA: AMP-binding protein [Streptosporangiaceae bacterium]|nr:AMP-binding protein [Streptosporangiaceae bacterium]